jgi:hypothetical protein
MYIPDPPCKSFTYQQYQNYYLEMCKRNARLVCNALHELDGMGAEMRMVWVRYCDAWDRISTELTVLGDMSPEERDDARFKALVRKLHAEILGPARFLDGHLNPSC